MTRSAAYDQGVSTTKQQPHAPLPLLVLGQGRELATERGVECPGELPAPSDPGLVERARGAKAARGDPCTCDQTRVGGCRQLTGTFDAPLGGELATLTQDEQGQSGVGLLFRCAHALIVCRRPGHDGASSASGGCRM